MRVVFCALLTGIATTAVRADERATGSWTLERTLVAEDCASGQGGFWNPCGVFDVAWSPDGQRLAVALMDGSARLWSAEGEGGGAVLRGDAARLVPLAGEDEAVAFTHADWVNAVAWAPDGGRLATGCMDDRVRIWSRGRETSALLPDDDPTRPHQDNAIRGLDWRLDGARVAAGSQRGEVRVWRLGAGSPVVLSGHENTVWSVAFSPDSERLATASEDGSVRIWRLNR